MTWRLHFSWGWLGDEEGAWGWQRKFCSSFFFFFFLQLVVVIIILCIWHPFCLFPYKCLFVDIGFLPRFSWALLCRSLSVHLLVRSWFPRISVKFIRFTKFCNSWIKIRTSHFLWSNLYIYFMTFVQGEKDRFILNFLNSFEELI